MEKEKIKAVFISGTGGFIGKELKRYLSKLGFIVTPYKDYILNQPENIASLKSALDTAKPDIFINLGAKSGVEWCKDNTEKAKNYNVHGAVTSLSVFKDVCPNGHYLFASTSHVYKGSSDKLTETSMLTEETDSYGYTKKIAEDKIIEIAKDSNIIITILRLFNYTHVTAEKGVMSNGYRHLSNLKENRENSYVDIHTDQSLDIGNIQDLCSAFHLAMIKPENGHLRIINVCSGTKKKFSEILNKLAPKMGIDDLNYTFEDRTLNQHHLGDCTKLISLGWKFCPESETTDVFVEKFMKKLEG
jgi:nucleoside-diphosphate-sugar epimerase